MSYNNLVRRVDLWIDEHMDELIDFTCKLIRIDTSTPPGRNYDVIADVVTSKLTEYELETEIHNIPDDLLIREMRKDGIVDFSGPRVNIVAYLGGGKPTLLTNGHIDVVPASTDGWSMEPFSGVVRDGKIYGRGASDMKGALGAMIYSMLALKGLSIKLKGSIVATFTTDEELGGYTGIKYLIDKGIINRSINYCISTDGNIDEIGIADLGDVEVIATVYGKSYHSGMGWRGVNAVEHTASLICKLKELANRISERRSKVPIKPVNGVDHMRPGLYVNVIEGGLKPNIIPDKCTIVIDRRIIPEENLDEALREIREVIEEYSRNSGVNIDFKYRAYYPPSKILNPDHQLIKVLQDSIREVLNINVPAVGAQGSSDISFISALGIPVVSTGVGREESNAHGVDENINVDDLKALTKILARCYIKLLETT